MDNGTQVNCRAVQKHCQKHKEVHLQKVKANPIANNERLQVRRKKKQKYRYRVKESIATATAANLVTEQNDDFAFSQIT